MEYDHGKINPATSPHPTHAVSTPLTLTTTDGDYEHQRQTPAPETSKYDKRVVQSLYFKSRDQIFLTPLCSIDYVVAIRLSHHDEKVLRCQNHSHDIFHKEMVLSKKK